MADLAQNSSIVAPSTSAIIILGIAGASLEAGQPIFPDGEDLDHLKRGKWKRYDCNATTPASILEGCKGIAAHNASAGQPIAIVLADPDFAHGLVGVVAGDVIIASATAGGQALVADLASGWRTCVTMIATSATKASIVLGQITVAKA